MSHFSIVTVPDKRLLLHSEEVCEVNQSIRKLVDDMFETMYTNKGLGLAAIQVGIQKRVIVVDVQEKLTDLEYEEAQKENKVEGYESYGGPYCIINPKIVELSKVKVNMLEGCLSVPGYCERIMRAQYITMQYLDYNGKECTIKAQGWLARCFQHEIDHLNGIMFLSYLSKVKRDLVMDRIRKKQMLNRNNVE